VLDGVLISPTARGRGDFMQPSGICSHVFQVTVYGIGLGLVFSV